MSNEAELKKLAGEMAELPSGEVDSKPTADFTPNSSDKEQEAGQVTQQHSGAEMYGGLWELVGMAAQLKLGAHWAIDPEESKQLGEATEAFASKYFPAVDVGVEYLFLGTVAAVFLPKYAEHKKLIIEGEPQPVPDNTGAKAAKDGD